MSVLPRHLLPDTADVAGDGWLTIGGCSIRDLAAEYGTPLFVYDEEHLRARCREAVEAFGQGNGYYASKAFLCRAMARLAYEEGMKLDVATGGELHVAVSAGIGNMPTREHTVEAWVRLEGVNDWSGPVSFGQDDGCVLCPNVIAASFAGGHII